MECKGQKVLIRFASGIEFDLDMSKKTKHSVAAPTGLFDRVAAILEEARGNVVGGENIAAREIHELEASS